MQGAASSTMISGAWSDYRRLSVRIVLDGMDLRVSAGPFHEGSLKGIRSCASEGVALRTTSMIAGIPTNTSCLGIHLFWDFEGTGVVWGCRCIRIDPTPFITDNKNPHIAAYHVDSADKQAVPAQDSRRPLHQSSRIHSHSDSMPEGTLIP